MVAPFGHVTKHSVTSHTKLTLSYSKVSLIYENISSVNSQTLYNILQSTCLGEVQTLKGKISKKLTTFVCTLPFSQTNTTSL